MNRRDALKLGALAGAASVVGKLAGAEPVAAKTPVPAPTLPVATITPLPGVEKAAKPLRILILGGTGFIGPHQVRYALARGHKLTLFNRGRRPKEWPGEVEELTGDRETGDLKSLEGREWDACIDNPTSTPYWVRDVGQALAGKVKQYVYVSSLSAYASMAKPGLTEDAPLARYTGSDVMKETRATLLANMNLYGPLKAACETEAEKQFPGIATIVRPTLIVGPGDDTDRFTYWPVRIAKSGEVLAPPPDDPVQLIDARDLAEWMVRLVEQRAFGAFNGVGPNYELSTAAMLHGIRAAGTSPAKFVFTDAEFVRKQNIRAWSEFTVWIPGQGETEGFHRTSTARALASGLTYRPLATTAADTLAWFNTLPEDRRAKLKAGLAPEKEAAALKAWKEVKT
ncbi:NAD-dependent epimerase/dehydratase family protein [Oleiharenicola lentus]|uniref:NAD-dependent epimerase/dehydratase family protein n=1 Tax=Oleiharenicola lentus TaxID=2508720 RepID=UPI003F680B20